METSPKSTSSRDVNQNDNGMLPNQMQFVREQLEKFQRNIVRDVEKRMAGMIEEVLQDMRQRELQAHEFRDFANSTATRATANRVPSSRHCQQSHHQQEETANATTKAEDETAQQQLPQHRQTTNMWNNRISRETTTTNGTTTTGAKRDDADDDDGETATTTSPTTTTTTAAATAAKSKKQRRTARTLPDKVFVMRESYLTALLQVDHMRTIYHIFNIILLILLLNTVCYDYFVDGSVKLGLGTFKSGLRGIHYVLGIWLLQHVFVFCLHYALGGWASMRQRLLGQAWLCRFWSHSCLIVYVASQLVFAYAATVMCLRLDLPYVSASVLLLESTRLLMKMHAYVRTNVARVLAGKQKLDDDIATMTSASSSSSSAATVRLPPFSCYLYFLFAPTLIYRDAYPRTARIRWRFALARFLEVVAVAFLYSYLHERHIYVHFGQFGREPISASAMIVKMFGMMMPGVLIFLAGFYLILHAWLNFTAEILRFGDRMFYKDWWTSITYEAYYRDWNVVVHDWLYEYIYKDFYTHIFKGSKLAASLTVFMISAVVHEHIIGVALQMFFPMMFVFFGGVGVAMIFITRHASKTFGNVMLWFSLITGNAALVSLYAMEYYARQNCPRTFITWTDYLTPALMTTCN